MGILRLGFIIFWLLFLTGISHGTTYTIGSSGDDYATFALYRAAHATDTAGDTISFRKGETFRESITATGSGASGNPIVFTSHGTGDLPIIQPTTQLTSWTQVGATNVYYATLATEPMIIMIGGVYCQPSHWPTTAGDSTPTFQYPSTQTAWNAYTLIDTDIDFDPTGAVLHAFQLEPGYQQVNKTVTGWDVGTHTASLSNNTPVADPDLTLYVTTRYFLTGLVSMIEENTWAWDDATDRLYVWKTGGGNPGTVEASISDHAFTAANRSYITIDSIHFRYTNADAIYVSCTAAECPGWKITNSQISYSAENGISLWTNLDTIPYDYLDVEITNNNVSYTCGKPGVYELDDGSCSGIAIYYDKHATVTGNTISYSGVPPMLPIKGSGIYVRFPTDGINYAAGETNNNTVSHCSYNGITDTSMSMDVKNNTVSDTNVYLSDGGGIYKWHSVGGTISGNTLSGGTGFGIYCDEHTDGVVVESNTVTGGQRGILLHESNNVIVRRNLVSGPFTADSSGGKYGIMVSAGDHEYSALVNYNVVNCTDNLGYGFYSLGGSPYTTNIYNNDFLNCSTGLGDQSNAVKRLGNIENNIFYGNTTSISLFTGGFTTVNYNLYYSGNWKFDGVTKATFADWKTAISQDGNSLNVDPMFINAVSNLGLPLGSPAISAGVNVGLALDYLGHVVPQGAGYDIGAYEYYVGGSITGLGFGLGGSIY